MDARWLKLNDAAKYSAIGRHLLKELAIRGAVRGYRDPESERGDWIFDRLSLDSYRELPLKEKVNPKEKALAIIHGISV